MLSAQCRLLILLAAPAAIALAAASGCSRSSTAAPGGSAAAPPPAASPGHATVGTVRPERQTVRRQIGQPGRIEAFQETPLFAKIAGFVQEVRADIGDVVDNGQTLAVLSVPEMDEELAQKEALVKQARAELDLARKAHTAAEARVHIADAQVDRWQSEYTRLEKLRKEKGVIEQQTIDETHYQLKAARAGQEESAAQRDRAEAAVRVAAAKLEVAQADRRRMAALLDYAEIKAPYDGVVRLRNVNKGDFAQPGTTKPLFVVVQTDPVRIFVDVPEADAVWVADGTPARVRLPALPGREFDAKVTRSTWTLDPQTRTLRAEIDVDNPRGLLRPGNYAYATIQLEHAKTWTLPADAVVQGDQAYVFRVENGKAVRTPVELGLREGRLVEVLSKQTRPARDGEKAVWEEFTGREEIVVAPSPNLTDGQAVSVTPAGR
jgi:RND family efflux transporter MFP subunit